ncbi:hypothetical protein COOONC_17935 [Cooperia oncophora]
MSYLSPSIVSCSQLTKLVIIRNELVPYRKLVFIDLSTNKLERLPASFSKLTKLETLVASGNQVKFHAAISQTLSKTYLLVF